MEPLVLSKKLDIILSKLRNDVQGLQADRLQQVLHSVHTISWIVIQSIIPYVQQEFRGQTVQVFQLITQLIKCIKETEFEEVSFKLFQQKAQRRRSLKLINCSVCDEYRRLPEKKDEKAYYAKYIANLKKESQLKQEQKLQYDNVLKSDDIKQQKQMNASCQVNTIEMPEFKEEKQEIIKIVTQTQEMQTDPIIQETKAISEEIISELKGYFVNYFNLVQQWKNVGKIVDEANAQCTIQQNLIKSTAPNIPVQQLKYISSQSVQQIQEILQKNKIDCEIVNSFKSKQLQQIFPSMEVFQKEVELLEHQRKAIEAGIVEYDKDFDPALLEEGMKVQFRIKLVDGVSIIEEVVVDKNGQIIRSRLRKRESMQDEEFNMVQQIQSKEQKIDEDEWIAKKYGDKIRVLEKKQTFTQYEVQQQESKKKIKISTIDGQKQIEEEWQSGGSIHKVYQSRGSLIYEEQGEAVSKKWSTKELGSNQVIYEEQISKDGSILKVLEKEKFGQDILKVIKRDNDNKIISSIVKQILKDDKGEVYQQEEEQKDDGERIVRKIYCPDGEYQKVSETTHLRNGMRKSIIMKKYKDKVETTYVDEYGDEIQSSKYSYIDESGKMIQCERKINTRTNEQTLQKQYQNQDGKLTIENITTLDGIEVSKQIIVQISPNERIERLTKNNKTLESKIVKDENGLEKVHMVDNEANMNIQTTNYVKDSIDYQQQIINLPNGAKRQVGVKTYFNENQDQIIEEDRIDEFGQRTLIKKRINALGEEIIEEFEIIESDSLVEFKKLKHIEKRLPRKDLIQLVDQGIQTDGTQTPIQFIQTQEQFIKKQQLPHQPQPVIINSQQDFNDIDKEAFNRLQSMKGKQDPQFQEAVLVIKKYFNKGETDELKQEEFNEYLNKLRSNHQRQCGEQCSHLLRFYAKLGFLIQKSSFNRQVYKLQKVQLQAKEQI